MYRESVACYGADSLDLYIKRNAVDHRMAGSVAANQIHTIPICLNGL